jgi:transformation/transcription domain-associated protein
VQVFVALLRTCQPENRVLVKQALDILMPALPRRLPLGENKIPIWIRYTKKILVEEGHSVPNLIHIFQLLVRHADLFYNCRAQFVPQMVNSLSRLGLPQNTPPENRRLAIDLAGLVVMWEKRRQAEAKVSNTDGDGQSKSVGADGQNPAEASTASGTHSGTKRTAEAAGLTGVGDDASKRTKPESGLPALAGMSPNLPSGPTSSIPNIGTPGSMGQADEEFKPNAAMEEMIINFLIRVIYLRPWCSSINELSVELRIREHGI